MASFRPAMADRRPFSSSPRARHNPLSSSLRGIPFRRLQAPLQARLVSSSLQQTASQELPESDHEESCHDQRSQDAELEGKDFAQGQRMSGRAKGCDLQMVADALPVTVHMHGYHQDGVIRAWKASHASAGEARPGASTDEVSVNDDGGSRSEQSSEVGCMNTTQHGDGSSSEKSAVNRLSVRGGDMGRVSPLRALSHIAHIKRKQDCLQNDAEEGRSDVGNDVSVEVAQESSSKRKRMKQVQFRLEPLAYQKLMKIIVEQYQGSIESFIMSSLDLFANEGSPVKRGTSSPRKLAFSKWKRTRFEQLRGLETEELALAFRALAESTPSTEVTSDLMHLPWQELNMLQVQKMLEQTKKMLLLNEKVHDCPFVDCGRRFSTPGHLKDHLNEHSGMQPYCCTFEDCAHRFRSKQHLCRHLKKHERAHTCTFEGCNKRFAFRERLIVHQKTHSDERPLSCPWEGCGKTFKWANSLHGHIRTHTGEKPFQCTFAGCGRLFGYKVDLTRHWRTHFGQPARASH